MQMVLDVIWLSLLVVLIDSFIESVLKLQRDRYESQRRFTTFLIEVFIPMVEKREAAQYPQRGFVSLSIPVLL
jgi:hypothetical protein